MAASRPGGPQPRRLVVKGYGFETAVSKPGERFSWHQAREMLAAARNYWFATASLDGHPHTAPVWGLWLNDAFYFSTARHSVKGRNLETNTACMVHLESGDDVVMLEGIVEEVGPIESLERFADVYQQKYDFRPDTGDAQNVTYRLRPQSAFTWRERDFPESATKWTFEIT